MNNKDGVIIYWSEEDGISIIKKQDSAEYILDGDVYTEAVINAENALLEWIVASQNQGEGIPFPNKTVAQA